MPATPTAPSPPTWFTRGGWWFVVHVGSLGLLAAVPFAHAAVRSRRIGHAVLAAVVLLSTLLAFLAVGTADEDVAGHAVGFAAHLGGTLLGMILLGGLVGLVVVRAQVYDPRPPRPSARGIQPAHARALAARARRDEARRLVVADPLLARELRIGRPDLAPKYDDGGLVDLNAAPARVVAAVCGIDPVQAVRIVQARQAAGRFAAVDDVFAWADLPIGLWDQVRDRAVVL